MKIRLPPWRPLVLALFLFPAGCGEHGAADAAPPPGPAPDRAPAAGAGRPGPPAAPERTEARLREAEDDLGAALLAWGATALAFCVAAALFARERRLRAALEALLRLLLRDRGGTLPLLLCLLTLAAPGCGGGVNETLAETALVSAESAARAHEEARAAAATPARQRLLAAAVGTAAPIAAAAVLAWVATRSPPGGAELVAAALAARGRMAPAVPRRFPAPRRGRLPPSPGPPRPPGSRA